MDKISVNILEEGIRTMMHNIEEISQRDQVSYFQVIEELRRVHELVHIVEIIRAFSLSGETLENFNVFFRSEAIVALNNIIFKINPQKGIRHAVEVKEMSNFNKA